MIKAQHRYSALQMLPMLVDVAAARALADAPEAYGVNSGSPLRQLPSCRQAGRKRIRLPSGSAGRRSGQPDGV